MLVRQILIECFVLSSNVVSATPDESCDKFRKIGIVTKPKALRCSFQRVFNFSFTQDESGARYEKNRRTGHQNEWETFVCEHGSSTHLDFLPLQKAVTEWIPKRFPLLRAQVGNGGLRRKWNRKRLCTVIKLEEIKIFIRKSEKIITVFWTIWVTAAFERNGVLSMVKSGSSYTVQI